MAHLRPLSWTGGPKHRLAGLGPELRHGTALSPQLSGPHSPAWSQGPSRVPSGLSRSWLTGEPQGGLGKRKGALPSLSTIGLGTGRCLHCWVPCDCQGTMKSPSHGPQVPMKWTKGEDPRLCRGPSLVLTAPPPPPTAPDTAWRAQHPHNPRGLGGLWGGALAAPLVAPLVSRWQATTLLSSSPMTNHAL